MKRRDRFSLAAVFFTFFVDTLCWSIVFPIFAPYFLESDKILSPSINLATRTTILGLFLMAFSLGQFFGAPWIGDYGDRHGRRKALLISAPSMMIGLVITALSMQYYNLFGLFAGRLITGVFSGNGPICLASVSDLCKTNEEKIKNFGYFSILAGFGFVIGSFVGGKLSDASINRFFSPDFPIWIAAAVSFLNSLFILFGFRETTHIKQTKKYSFFSSFQNVKTALRNEKIHTIYMVYFLFIFSWNIFLQFIPVVLIKRFGFTESNIGDLGLYVGICWAVGSGHLKQWLASHFRPRRILKISFLILACLSAYVVFPKHIYYILSLLGLSIIIGGMIWPLCTTIISNLAPENMQGKILSISQSVQSLAMTIAPVIAGLAFKSSSYLPFLIGAFSFLIAGLLLWRVHFNQPALR